MDLGNSSISSIKQFRSIRLLTRSTDNSNKIGYGEAFWNEDFVNRFSDTDVRNTFFDLFGLGDNSGSYKARASSKFKLTFDPDIPLMRSPEMLLIEAEAKARQE